MSKEIGIYKIESPTGKIYIGQSEDIRKRKYAYSNISCVAQKKLYSSLKKHGWDAHKFEVIFKPFDTSTESLNKWEQFFMDYYRSGGYELMNLREAGSRGKHSDETKAKMKIAQKGLKSGEKHPNFGKKRSPETVRKMSESNKGKKRTQEFCNKMSEHGKRLMTPDRVKKLISSRTPHPPEHYEYLSKKFMGGNSSCAVPIIQLTKEGEFIKEWGASSEAARELGLSRGNISSCLVGKRNFTGGYKWEYKYLQNV